LPYVLLAGPKVNKRYMKNILFPYLLQFLKNNMPVKGAAKVAKGLQMCCKCVAHGLHMGCTCVANGLQRGSRSKILKNLTKIHQIYVFYTKLYADLGGA
jgi:hypothetical protein